jgi:hypothetical protein
MAFDEHVDGKEGRLVRRSVFGCSCLLYNALCFMLLLPIALDGWMDGSGAFAISCED